MKECFSKKEIEHFCNDQVKIANKYCEIYGISPEDLLLQVYEKIKQEIDDPKKDEFARKIVSDPIAFRILFIVNTPPEDFKRRIKLYKLSSPIQDHRCLLLLAKDLPVLGLGKYLRNLAHEFMVNWIVDYQKLNGRSGTITELRENYEKVTALEDGTQKWEIDLWPRATVVLFVRIVDRKVEAHFYPLKNQGRYELNNLIDEFMIGWMQDFKVKELRDDAYEFRRGDPEVLIYIYDLEGKLLEKFPFALKEKYKPLLKRQIRNHLLKGSSSEQLREITSEAEAVFFKSIIKYPKETKPFPPGYFNKAIQHKLSELYEKDKEEKKVKILSLNASISIGQDKSIPLIEIVKNDSTADYVRANDELSKLEIKDPIDEIIFEHFDKSCPKIAEVIRIKLGVTITKQAVLKRKNKLKSIIMGKKALQIDILRMEEGEMGVDPLNNIKQRGGSSFFDREENEKGGVGKVFDSKNYSQEFLQRIVSKNEIKKK